MSFSYGRHRVLEDITLEIRTGVHCLVGVNGAGKTTLLRLAVGALRLPRGAGEIQCHRLIGFVPQTITAVRGMTAAEYVEYFACLRGLTGAGRRESVRRALQATGVEEQAAQTLRSLSGGTLRRVAVASAMVGTTMLVLDEPTAGLDPVQRERLAELIGAIGSERPVFFSTHIAADACEVADRILVLAGRHLVLDQSAANFFASGTGSEAPEARLLEVLRTHSPGH